jgi:hypothetical protein
MDWQEAWIEGGQRGFRAGHRSEDVLMELGMEIEDALLSGEPLYGVALDFAKCFDRVPQEIVLSLVNDLGMGKRILSPLRSMYKGLTRRFKLPLGVGSVFEVTNGILQGCPISVILINALLSVLMKAIDAETDVHTKSYADDANLLSRSSEAALQLGVDLVDEFCLLTGMKLNLAKTIAFSTRAGHKSTLQLRSAGQCFPASTTFKCLGAKMCTKGGNERIDSERVLAAAEAAANLVHIPIPFKSKVAMVQSSILPAALTRCSFAPVAVSAMKKLSAAVMTGTWGPRNPKRAQEAVLNVLERGHLTSPSTCLAYRVTTSFYSACERLPHLVPLARRIRNSYVDQTSPLGPVGIAVRYGLDVCGHRWDGGPLTRITRNGRLYDPLAKTTSQRNHDVRADLKALVWSKLEQRRPSFAGIGDADLETTNSLWDPPKAKPGGHRDAGDVARRRDPKRALLIRVAIAGGVNSAEYLAKLRRGGEEGAPVSAECTSCSSGAVEDEAHIFWECSAYAAIRGKAEYASVFAADRSAWPRCLLEHGIATTPTKTFGPAVQAMMADVLEQRAQAVNQLWAAERTETPWGRCEQAAASKHEFPYLSVAPGWSWTRSWDVRTFLAVVDWMAGLEWSTTGEATMTELAVDFELYSGLDATLPKKGPGCLRDRANGLRCMMSAVMKLAVQQGLGNCLPGEMKRQTTTLSFIGLPGVPGLKPRPRFRMPETGRLLLEQVRGADVSKLRPVYPPDRSARAAQWAEPATPMPCPDPVHLPNATHIDASGALKCVVHRKGKCGRCSALLRRDAPAVEACCRHHHRDDDGLPVGVCPMHRLSKCAECSGPSTCCSAGHHACKAHAKGACAACQQLPTLAERRPAACCRRGHHVPSAPPSLPKDGSRGPRTPPRRVEARASATPVLTEVESAANAKKRPLTLTPSAPANTPKREARTRPPPKTPDVKKTIAAAPAARAGRKRPHPSTPAASNTPPPVPVCNQKKPRPQASTRAPQPDERGGRKRALPDTPTASSSQRTAKKPQPQGRVSALTRPRPDSASRRLLSSPTSSVCSVPAAPNTPASPANDMGEPRPPVKASPGRQPDHKRGRKRPLPATPPPTDTPPASLRAAKKPQPQVRASASACPRPASASRRLLSSPTSSICSSSDDAIT